LRIYSLFTDYEKAFGSIQRHIMFDTRILKSRNIPYTLLQTTADIYTRNKILVHINS